MATAEEKTDVTISQLTGEIVQVAYKDLHALLDSLTEYESDERRTRLLDYVASTRHRIVRLLVAVRWLMECSSYHLSAASLRNIGQERSTHCIATADKLFGVRLLTLGAAAESSAVAFAGEIMSGGMSTFRLPRIIEGAADIDTLAQKDNDEPKGRVRRETRYALRVGLPTGVTVLQWNAPPHDLAVRVGIHGVWYADVVLDTPDLGKANFRIHDFKILIRAHIDAYGPVARLCPEDSEPMPMTKDHFSRICALVEDRMSWAAHDATDNGPTARAEASLHCMSMIFTREICTALVLQHVRQQVKPLIWSFPWRPGKLVLHGLGSEEGALVPVSVKYWTASPHSAKITFAVPDDDGYIESDSPSSKGKPHQVIHLVHEPDLPMLGNEVRLDLTNIDVEGVLLASVRRRAQHILALINDAIKQSNLPITQTTLATLSEGAESLNIDVGGIGFGLQLIMSLRTGAFHVRLRGATSLSSHRRLSASHSLCRTVWKGEKHFPNGVAGVQKALLNIIQLQVVMLNITSVEMHCAMADELTLLTWPPGVCSVELPKNETINKFDMHPPFIGVERNAPRKFLTAFSWLSSTDDSATSDVDPSKRTRKSPVNFETSKDALVFIQGKEPYGMPPAGDARDFRYSASISARFAALRHANGLRFRRDQLLRELSFVHVGNALSADIQLRNSMRTAINLTSTGQLPMSRAYVVLSGVDKWRVDIELNLDIFDSASSFNQMPFYGANYIGGSKPMLTFSYQGSRKVVPTFNYHLKRACKLAAVVRSLASPSQHLVVDKRTPLYISFRAYGLDCAITWLVKGYKISMRTEKENAPIKYCARLVQYVEEAMDSVLAENLNLTQLFEQSLPLILVLEKLCALDWVGPPKFRSPMRLFLTFRSGGATNVLDIDSRIPKEGYITLTDLGRVLRSRAPNGCTASVAANANARSSAPMASVAGIARGAVAVNAVSHAAAAKTEKTSLASRSGTRSDSGVGSRTGSEPEPIANWEAVTKRMEEKNICRRKNNNMSIVVATKFLEKLLCILAGPTVNSSVRTKSGSAT